MKALTVSALVCALVALTRADPLPEALPEKEQIAKSDLVKRSLACYGDWTEFSGRCFRYIRSRMTWAQAEKNCDAMGGNLASIHSIVEYHVIQGLIMRATHRDTGTWIGGSDAQEEKEWFWSDGSPFHYTNWCSGQPNNSGGRQSCLHMNFGAQKCWNDYQCVSLHPSVCAKKIGFLG